MEELSKILQSAKSIAVVGVSRNKEKYGYKVWKYLKDKGYEVYAINPNADTIDGEKCYSSVKEIGKRLDIITFVVPPHVTERMVREGLEGVNYDYLWFQPGSENDDIITYCKKNNIKEVHGVCIMQTLGKYFGGVTLTLED